MRQQFGQLQVAWICRCLEGDVGQRITNDLMLLENGLELSNRRNNLQLPSEINEIRFLETTKI